MSTASGHNSIRPNVAHHAAITSELEDICMYIYMYIYIYTHTHTKLMRDTNASSPSEQDHERVKSI